MVICQNLAFANPHRFYLKKYLFSVQLGLTPSASAKEPEKSIPLTMDKQRRVIYIG